MNLHPPHRKAKQNPSPFHTHTHTMAATELVSIYCDLSEEGKLSIVHPEGYEPACGVKLRVLGETHILLDANGVLLQGVHRATDKTVELRCLERDVLDFDTEGNWIFCIKADSGTVHRSRNGSLDDTQHYDFDELEINSFRSGAGAMVQRGLLVAPLAVAIHTIVGRVGRIVF